MSNEEKPTDYVTRALTIGGIALVLAGFAVVFALLIF